MSEPKPMPTYWALAEEVTHLHGQLDKLQDENAKLRESNNMLAKLLGDRTADCHKLRELVRDMWNGMCGYGHDCRSCEHYELCAGQRFVGECEYHRRIHELGIEVDGCPLPAK